MNDQNFDIDGELRLDKKLHTILCHDNGQYAVVLANRVGEPIVKVLLALGEMQLKNLAWKNYTDNKWYARDEV